MSDEENENNADIDPIEVTIAAGQLLVVLHELQFPENAKFRSTKANTNNEEAVARPRPQTLKFTTSLHCCILS